MFTKARNPTMARSPWVAPLAICCLLFILALVAATIVIALIPVYLTSKDVTVASPNAYNFNTLYATDVSNGRSLTLSGNNDLTTQVDGDIPGGPNILSAESGQFLSATAASRRKRQTSFGTITCEQATGLTGDIFSLKNKLNIPAMHHTQAAQTKYLERYQNYIRNKHKRKTVTMDFTTGSRAFTIAFCGFTAAVKTGSGSSPGTSPGNGSNSTLQCSTETATYIYVMEAESRFYYFNPITYDGYYVGTVECINQTSEYKYHAISLAIQSNGTVWVLYDDANLYTFDIQTGDCKNTSYLYGQDDIYYFGMTFVNDSSTNTEKLYLTTDTEYPPFRLATLDINNFKISVIRYYDNIVGRGELTSANNGRLFGLFEGTPFILAEINTTNANIISKKPQNSVQYVSDSSYFAVQAYKSDFFLMAGNGTVTNVYLYNSTTGTATLIKTFPFQAVGVSASVCINDFILD